MEELIDKTYKALLLVVQTTAVTRRVLARPPFTFLHKLLVETLAQHNIFSEQQLVFAELTTREDKAAFLTRALAFVTYVMAHSKEKRVSCLLLVSPIKVLAGVAVSDTLEFLLQLCDVCKGFTQAIKDAAAKELLQKGDAQLYTSGVVFRRGLILIQAIIRAFIKRRVGKRRSSTIIAHSGSNSSLEMKEGTTFLKELSDGRIYDGIIKSIHDKTYVLAYDQEDGQEEVDEIEMKIILEESQRLVRLRDNLYRRKSVAGGRGDEDLSLTVLPDLSARVDDSRLDRRLSKRHSSRDAATIMSIASTLKPRGSLTLSQGDCDNKSDGVGSSRREKVTHVLARLSSGKVLQPRQLDSNQAPLVEGADTRDEIERQAEASNNNDDESKLWQDNLRKMLVKGQQDSDQYVHKRPSISLLGSSASSPSLTKAPRALVPSSTMPKFPKLSIPGLKPIQPTQPQRSPAALKQEQTPKQNSTKLQNSPPRNETTTTGAATSKSPKNTREKSADKITTLTTTLDGGVDAAFAGKYQTTDQKTQEKLALFREIVRRIDSYMKRKHLRVIDLFRYCDADGNGSISPQEMLDTLSQMEIQLSSEQAQDFINYIDKDGNGAIDIDEFEELVRVARRNEAQRDQIRRELAATRRVAKEPKAKPKPNIIMHYRQRILDAYKAFNSGDFGPVATSQLRSALIRLQLPRVTEQAIDQLIVRAHASAPNDHPQTPGSTPSSRPSSSSVTSTSATSGFIYQTQLVRALDEIEMSTKSNRFLDQSWINQFDSQVERAIREYELL
ncbi:TPA: hypothetical protein N0F65_001270 [Lagenidium giganteum]|uniref:EF-hand domain-containing protein n=1 Tax=Lagenidium giganteum TaxID=4803 RepID=A0AAV2YUN2_9STRA|nr:TPA: hypothetical protein N0F65_001270 [Lagenidium giganteum]